MVGMVFMLGLKKVGALVIGSKGTSPAAPSAPPRQAALIWLVLFSISAMLHGAESAFTKINPFKVKEYIEEEGAQSPFATLANSNDSTRMLTTILLTTTSLSIYSTALFVATASIMFPALSLGTITAGLTGITLLFGEILPKALAVSNPEVVVRLCARPINWLAQVLTPLSATVTVLSKVFLGLLGLQLVDDKAVSEDMLRMMVVEAQRDPSTGIESREGRMIEGVLDLQEQTVDKIMCPRIDVLALPEETTVTELLRTAITERYSRIPIYSGDIDNIQGIVILRDLLHLISLPEEGSERAAGLAPKWAGLTAADIMVPTYYVPETMSTWTAMQELRRRKKHMAIVVDEYGGTAGLVTFEDILEEVVGEIYDESDDKEEKDDLQTIFKDSSGCFNLAGNADLDDMKEALGMEVDEEVIGDTSTVGGLISRVMGSIPEAGEEIVLGGYRFKVLLRDERRIVSVQAEECAELPDGWIGDFDAYKRDRDEQRAIEEAEAESKSRTNSGDKGDKNKSSSDDEREGSSDDGINGSGSPAGLIEVPEGTTLSFRDGEWVATTRIDDDADEGFPEA
jgi:putative hemolysin